MKKKAKTLHIAFTLSATAFALVIAYWRFAPWMPHVFFGDDLANLLAYQDGHFASTFLQALGSAYAEKYRPVFALLLGTEFWLFGSKIAPYLIVNILIQAVNVTLVFLVAFMLSKKNYWPAFAAAAVAASSRFALYQITQVTGLLEGTGLLFCLATIYCLLRSNDESSTWRWAWLAIAAAFLSMLTHERYVVLAPWLCIALAISPNISTLPRIRRFILIGAAAATLAFNAFYKVFVLHTPFFVGTGGTELGFNLARTLEHLSDAVLSISGFNSGPEYLVGASWHSLEWFPILVLAGVFTISWLIAIVLAIYFAARANLKGAHRPTQSLYWPALLAFLAALLLAPPILTIRLEQRWLLEPLILAALIFSWASGVITGRRFWRIQSTLAITFGVCALLIDAVYAPFFKNIFFYTSAQLAESVRQQVLTDNAPKADEIALLTDPNSCGWTLQAGRFLHLYAPHMKMATCFGTTDEALKAMPPPATRFYSSQSPFHFVDVTDSWNKFARSHSIGNVKLDFLSRFSQGLINSEARVSSPSGRGVASMQWESTLGTQNTLTVISGFSYRYRSIHIEPRDKLHFAIGQIYNSAQASRAEITVDLGKDHGNVVFVEDLAPPPPGNYPSFSPRTVDLSKYADRTVSITFSATSPGGDAAGHWIGFADPRIEQESKDDRRR